MYTVALLSGPAGRKVKVKVDKNSSLTTEAGTLAQSHYEGSKLYQSVEKLLSYGLSEQSKIRSRNATEKYLTAGTRT